MKMYGGSARVALSKNIIYELLLKRKKDHEHGLRVNEII